MRTVDKATRLSAAAPDIAAQDPSIRGFSLRMPRGFDPIIAQPFAKVLDTPMFPSRGRNTLGNEIDREQRRLQPQPKIGG